VQRVSGFQRLVTPQEELDIVRQRVWAHWQDTGASAEDRRAFLLQLLQLLPCTPALLAHFRGVVSRFRRGAAMASPQSAAATAFASTPVPTRSGSSSRAAAATRAAASDVAPAVVSESTGVAGAEATSRRAGSYARAAAARASVTLKSSPVARPATGSRLRAGHRDANGASSPTAAAAAM
jgi:hypothetical protein